MDTEFFVHAGGFAWGFENRIRLYLCSLQEYYIMEDILLQLTSISAHTDAEDHAALQDPPVDHDGHGLDPKVHRVGAVPERRVPPHVRDVPHGAGRDPAVRAPDVGAVHGEAALVGRLCRADAHEQGVHEGRDGDRPGVAGSIGAALLREDDAEVSLKYNYHSY